MSQFLFCATVPIAAAFGVDGAVAAAMPTMPDLYRGFADAAVAFGVFIWFLSEARP